MGSILETEGELIRRVEGQLVLDRASYVVHETAAGIHLPVSRQDPEGFVPGRVVRIADHETAKTGFLPFQIPMVRQHMLLSGGLQQGTPVEQVERVTEIPVPEIHPLEPDGIVAGIEVRNQILTRMVNLDATVRYPPMRVSHRREKDIVGILADPDVIMLPENLQNQVGFPCFGEIGPIIHELDFHCLFHFAFQNINGRNKSRITGSLVTKQATTKV